MAPRRVVIIGFPAVQALDVTGPVEVFDMAGRGRPDAYEVRLAVPGGAAVATSSGLTLAPHLDRIPDRVDTLVVAGGAGVQAALDEGVVTAWLREAAPRARRVASVCNGAFLLAAAGLLDGRRAATHWAACDELGRRHPEVSVQREPIFVRDGPVWTSAGVTAGIDLALAMVEEDLGRDAALAVARNLVLFLRRPGGQSQFSAGLTGQEADRRPLRELQAWLADHLGEDLNVEALAARAHMSPRNFARAFRRETGSTPAAYVERLRLERARVDLEGGDAPVDEIARRWGFGTPETMRRAFARRLRVSPSDYRRRFRGHSHSAV